jgi:hypothetical protein
MFSEGVQLRKNEKLFSFDNKVHQANTQGCQIALGTKYQNGEIYTK